MKLSGLSLERVEAEESCCVLASAGFVIGHDPSGALFVF